ncbi:MAG: hypothetical protein A2161_00660 [Candidatus Schekmanbacteria bacterium RBG_13_48_7]|uniref:Uncharacterized protein n=1 Tax=Candidatus Schekmanbacteria bacterium RBG_13_48_7 TaxID=1817878 RepID=A0A1F7RPE8_9BACT|nr:MAG: hypothetical protein A2161_00660 [Candidatus Schekmanbacteria bacterium RBG_13_48_7]
MSKTLKIILNDEILLSMNKEPARLAEEIRLAAAVKWYELGMISQDMAAQLSGLSRAEFIFSLNRFAVSPFQETTDEIIRAVKDP